MITTECNAENILNQIREIIWLKFIYWNKKFDKSTKIMETLHVATHEMHEYKIKRKRYIVPTCRVGFWYCLLGISYFDILIFMIMFMLVVSVYFLFEKWLFNVSHVYTSSARDFVNSRCVRVYKRFFLNIKEGNWVTRGDDINKKNEEKCDEKHFNANSRSKKLLLLW